MTLKELQLKIAATLNDDADLRQGGCRAFAEDAHDVVQEVATHLHEVGGVALVVLTPSAEREGFHPDGLPARLDGVAVAAVEIPALNRLDGGPTGAVPDGHELAPLPVSRKLQAPCNILARRLKCFSRFPTS